MLVGDSAMPSGERVKLLDFGVAKLALALHAADSQVRTHSGQTLGTPQYMSPEQCRDVSQVDGMTDVYALGVILYQMLCGHVPFISSGEFAIAAMHLYEPPPPLQSRAPQVAELTAELVHRMLAKSKDERPTMAQVLTVLQTMGINVTASTQKASAISLGGQSGSISMADIQAAERSGLLGELSGVSGRNIPAALLSGSIPAMGTNPTTLGTGTGQLTGRSSRLFWGVTAGAGASVLAVTLLASGILSDNKSATAPVRWQVNTRPPGATVLRSDTGTILGQTPWHYEQPASAGKLQVSIQFTGYQTNTLTLDSSRDESMELTLLPTPTPKVEPPPPPPPPPKHRSHSHKAKPDDEVEAKDEPPQ